MHCQITFLVLEVRDETLHKQHLISVSNVKVTGLDQGCDSRSVAVLAVFLVVNQGTASGQPIDGAEGGFSAVWKILSSSWLSVGAQIRPCSTCHSANRPDIL